jgi:hypothetical protein
MIKSKKNKKDKFDKIYKISFRYIMAGLSTGCLIVFNVNFNVLNQPRREPGTPTANV